MRVCIKMRFAALISLLSWALISPFLFFNSTALAQNRSQKSQPAMQRQRAAKKPAPARVNPTKPETVGDVLRNIEKKAENVNFNKQQSQLPATARTAPPVARPVNLRAVSPPKSQTLYYSEDSNEAELEKLLDDQINQLFRLTQQYRNSSKRGELWLRLAELYVEKARLIEFRAHKKHEKEMQEFDAGQRETRPVLNLNASREFNRKAIQLYEWFIREFPNDPKMDQALFFLGFNHFELNEVKKGEEYYLRLNRDYPQSQYILESQFALAEFHFDNQRWEQSLEFYEKVGKNKTGRLYSFALYKSAWCHYKLQRTRNGLRLLETVILEGRRERSKSDSTSGVSRVRLATEAIKDLIIFYAEVGDPAQARSYFERVVGRRSALANVGRLAQYYMDTGNRSAARTLFKELIAESPQAPRAFDYQHNIVKMYQASGQIQTFLQELNSWLRDFGPRSSWQAVNSREADLVKKANEIMETTLRQFVLQQHQTAQNSKTRTAQESARQGYDLYFKTFSEGPKIDEMHFFFGELLFDLQDYERASFHYQWVYENAPKSQYVERALLNSLLALEKKLPNEKDIKKIVPDNTTPVEFTPPVKAFEFVARNYLETQPKGDNVVTVKYRLGTLYYYFNNFDPALVLFNDIVKNHNRSELARFSANHILDIYNLKNDYAGLQAAAQDILKVPEIAGTDVGRQIEEIKLRTEFKLAKELEDQNDFLGAAKSYESFAQKNKTSALAPSALFNAAVNFERAGLLLNSIQMYSLVLATKQKENEKLRESAAQFLPSLYERTGQYARAAQAFEQFAQQYPNNKLAVEYYYNAALIYDGLNSNTLALRNYDKYFNLKKTRDRLEVLFLQARLHERSNQIPQAIRNYEQYLNSDTSNSTGVVETHYRLAKIYEAARNSKAAEEWFKKTVAVHRRLKSRGQDVGVAFAAEAQLKLTLKNYNEFVAVKIPRAAAQQAEAVQRKLRLLNTLQAELKKVIAYDDAYQIVAALTWQGQALEHMYSSLISAPVPTGLTEEELKTYREGIDKIANPFKEQSIASYELALSRGYELQAYNRELITAFRQLEVLKGNKPPLETRAVITKLVDWMDGEIKSKEFTKSDIQKLTQARQGRQEQALIAVVSEMLAKNNDAVEPLNALAVHYAEAKRYGMAKIILRRALRTSPDEPALHNNLGVIFLIENEPRLALESFRKSIQLKNNYRIGAANLASIYLEHRDFNRSLSPLEDIYKATRQDLSRGADYAVDIANNYALALMGNREPQKAQDVFQQIIDAKVRSVTVHLNYSILLTDVLNKKKDALRLISQLKLMTDDREILKQVQELEKRAQQ